MKASAEVIIIGGGPCGSFAALNLAKRGINVKVFEEHSEIGFPTHCPGHLSLKGLKDLGLLPLPTKVVENTFYGARFYSPRGVEFTVRFPNPLTCIVNRALFDRHVADLAKSHGAEYGMGKRVESLIVENNFVKGIKFSENGQCVEEFAKIVIDAEGISSRILRQADLSPINSSMIVKGAHAEVENVKDMEQDIVQVFLGNAYAHGFYAWVIPKKDGMAKIGLATRTGNPKELLQKFMSKHPTASKVLCSARILHVTFHPISLGGFIPKAFSNGFLAIGDVASQVKPTTGGGVILGMNCARIAAETTNEALLTDDFSAKLLGGYQNCLLKDFGFDMKLMLRIRRMLDAMSDDELDFLIKTCVRLNLDEKLRDFSDLDFQGKALLKLLPKPKVLQALFAFFLLYLSAKL
jgi:geranylgeranyl reductase family protein